MHKRIGIMAAVGATLAAPFAALAIWGASFSGSAPAMRPSGGAGTPPPDSPSTYSASWAMGYDNVAQLTTASDLIAIGQVASRQQYQSDGIFYTEFGVKVVRALKGSPGATILVLQTGGVDDKGNLHEVQDDPMFEDGATYMLFLKKDPQSARYYVAGGPQGRLVVAGQAVSSLSVALHSNQIADLRLQNVPVEGVVQQVNAQP